MWVSIRSCSLLYYSYPCKGEGVADILGLDDSKFQDIVDSMTEEEWEVAREVIYQY